MGYSLRLPSYSVGVDCYKEIPYYARRFGNKAVVIGGKTAMEKAKKALIEGIEGSDMEILDFIWYGGDSTYENGNMLIENETVKKADIIFAVGGGRACDTCKYIADVCVVIVLAYVLVTFICCRSTVVGNSMEETLSNDNTVLINRISYAFNGPKRFDCIAFEQDSVDSSKIYIKRVVGLPGETVQIKDGRVYINDVQLDDYVDTTILTPGAAANPYKLAADEYFVLGDNRNNSEDSRFASVGMVKRKNVVGKVWMVIEPFDSFGFVK